MLERISKILSAHGVCSRRAAEELIRNGAVTLAGEPVVIGQKADTQQLSDLAVRGVPLCDKPKLVYYMLNKPRGYVTTVSDERGRKTVMELLNGISARVWPVGRLDYLSEGLLLFTNDGDLTQELLHPSREISKRYEVKVRGNLDQAVPILCNMTEIENETIRKPEIIVLQRDQVGGTLAVIIHEGKNRQIRRMCALAELEVLRLKRVAEGPLQLGTLGIGKWRTLTDNELEQIKESMKTK